MKLKLKITNFDSAAMQDPQELVAALGRAHARLAEVVEEMGDKVEKTDFVFPIRDSNGVIVGTWEIK